MPNLIYKTKNSGVHLKHSFYPAYETPEHTLVEHHICLYVGKPLTYEQVIKGKLRSQTCIYGDMVIYPAGLTQKAIFFGYLFPIKLHIRSFPAKTATQKRLKCGYLFPIKLHIQIFF